MKKAPKMSAGEVLGLLRRRYEESAGWQVFEQVTNGTGYKTQHRSADALALQTFPSRGIRAEGFEVKVSRSDVIKELRDPQKADAVQRWCEAWWLVVGDEDIVRDLVVPDTWGILAPAPRGGLRVVRAAPKLTPQPWTPAFVAAVCRRFAAGQVPKSRYDELEASIEKAVEERLEAAVQRELRNRAHEYENAVRDLAELRKKVDAFERTSGLRLSHEWRPEDLGQVVSVVRQAARDAGSTQGDLQRVATRMRSLASQVEEALGELAKVAAIDDAPNEAA